MSLAKLGNDADLALQRGELDRALRAYAQLAEQEPANPRWAGGMALVFKKQGRRGEEIDALARVARLYVDARDTLRAIATLKHVLALAPDHVPARRALSALTANVAQAKPAAAPAVRAPTAESGPLERVSLRQVVVGSVPAERTRMHRIPLPGEDASMELSLTGAPRKKAKPEDFSLEEALVADVAAEVRTAQRAQTILPKVELFQRLDPATLDELVTHAKLVELAQGQECFHQGDPSDALYIVANGQIGVVDEGPPRRGVAKLDPGGIFGEIGIVTDRPRTATTLALAPSEVLVIDREVVRRLIGKNPDALLAMLAFMRDRMIGRLVSTHPLFSVLSPADAERLKQRLQFFEVEPGAVLVEAGTVPSALYVLLAGRAEVVSERPELLDSGDLVGEISLVLKRPEPSRVRAQTKCWVIAMSAGDFAKIIEARPEAKAFVEQGIAARLELHKKRWGA